MLEIVVSRVSIQLKIKLQLLDLHNISVWRTYEMVQITILSFKKDVRVMRIVNFKLKFAATFSLRKTLN
jgi:hypothetical protein